jgi:hypothetical protein
VLTASAWSGNLRIVFIKVDSLNNLQWSIAIPWPDNYTGYYDSFDMCPLPGGGCVILLKGSALLLKISKSGDIDWSKSFSDTLGNHVFNDIVLDKRGRILAAGNETFTSSTRASLIHVIDTNGVVLESIAYINTNNDTFEAIVASADSGFILAGFDANGSIVITHCDSAGVVTWESKHIISSLIIGLRFTEMIETSDKSIVITGCSIGQGVVFKFDSTGLFVWSSNYYYYQTTTQYNGLIETSSSYVICGAVSPSANCGMNGLIIAIDKANGTKVWHATFGDPDQPSLFATYFNSIEKTATGFLLGGFSNILRPPLSTKNAVLVLTNHNGQVPCYNSNLALNQGPPMSLIPVSSTTLSVAGTISISTWDCIPYNLAMNTSGGCTVGLPEVLDERSISIYPNPTNEVLHVWCSVGAGHINVLSTLGSVVFSGELVMGDNPIDVSNFNRGVYFVVVSSDDTAIQLQKFIVQ